MNRNFRLASGELPLLPPLRAQMMSVLWNPRAEIRDVVAAIEPDSQLARILLAAANSPYFAPRTPVRSPKSAAVQLGLDTTREVLAAAVMRPQFEHLDHAGLNVRVLWRRQLAVGLLTREFSRLDGCTAEEAGVAFIAGLLQPIGRLALAARSPQRYRAAVQLVREGADVLDSERQAFGVDSVVMTRQVASRWSLPAEIADALDRHADLEADGLARALRDAIEVADMLGFDEGFAELAPDLIPLPTSHARSLGLDASGGVERLVQRVDWLVAMLTERPETMHVHRSTRRDDAETMPAEERTGFSRAA